MVLFLWGFGILGLSVLVSCVCRFCTEFFGYFRAFLGILGAFWGILVWQLKYTLVHKLHSGFFGYFITHLGLF